MQWSFRAQQRTQSLLYFQVPSPFSLAMPCLLFSLIPICTAAHLAQDMPLRDFSSLRQGIRRPRMNPKSPLPWVTALTTKQQHWRSKSRITSVKGNLAVMFYTEKNIVLMWYIYVYKFTAHVVISGCIMVDFCFRQAGTCFHRKEQYTEVSFEALRELPSQVEACHLQE